MEIFKTMQFMDAYHFHESHKYENIFFDRPRIILRANLGSAVPDMANGHNSAQHAVVSNTGPPGNNWEPISKHENISQFSPKLIYTWMNSPLFCNLKYIYHFNSMQYRPTMYEMD